MLEANEISKINGKPKFLPGGGLTPDVWAAIQAESASEAEEKAQEPIVTRSNFQFDRASIIDPLQTETKEVEWLAFPYLPVGLLVSAEGSSDLGKTFVMLDWIARLTTNATIPGAIRSTGPIGAVYVTYEDDIQRTIVPRLKKAGADLSKVRIVGYVKDSSEDGASRPLMLDHKADLELLESAIEQVDAKVLVIDPITSAFSSKIDPNKSADVRRGLAPIVELANRKGVTIVNIRHQRKGTNGNFKERGVGTMAFQEVARVGIAFEENPDDETENERLLVHFKHNLTPEAKPQRYVIVGSRDEIARVQWIGESALTKRQILDRQPGAQGELRQEIARLIDGYNCFPREKIIMELPAYKEQDIDNTLSRMARSGQLTKSGRGVYCNPQSIGAA